MSFLYKNHSAVPPPGTIVQYIGSSDPDGWLICDGVQRIDPDSKGIYQALNSILGTGISDPNKCTPPNLKGKFLYGASSTSTGIGGTGGSTTKSILVGNLPSHTHVVVDGEHNHVGSSTPHTHTFSGIAHTHTATDSGHTHGYTAPNTTNTQSGSATQCYINNHSNLTTGTGYANITVGSGIGGGSNSSETVIVSVDKAKSNISIGSTGSGESFDIMPPYFVINHIIKY